MVVRDHDLIQLQIATAMSIPIDFLSFSLNIPASFILDRRIRLSELVKFRSASIGKVILDSSRSRKMIVRHRDHSSASIELKLMAWIASVDPFRH